jgi:pyridoxal phosphate enzyme (YggS family)
MQDFERVQSIVKANWQRVSEQVHEACLSCDREPTSVRVVGVSKYISPQLAVLLNLAGCQTLGENRPQQLWEKHAYFCEQPATDKPLDVQWHMIGHLQRNKIRRTLPLLSMLHSLDSPRLAQAVNEEATKQGLILPVLIEVNVSQDPSKTGLQESELGQLVQECGNLSSLSVEGLMAMSSWGANATQARTEFAKARELKLRIEREYQVSLPHLSMGMSGDFAEAIQEGATLVRIGSSLWEGLR